MKSLNLGTPEEKFAATIVAQYSDYNWSEVENTYNFVLGSDEELEKMFNDLVDNVSDIATLEIVFDFEEEFKEFREAIHNVIEYTAGVKAMEEEFFKMFGLRNEVLEGRYLRMTATKAMFVKQILENKDFPESNKKARVSMRILFEGGNK